MINSSEFPYKLPHVEDYLDSYNIYETKSRLYIIANNRDKTLYKMIKIERNSDHHELIFRNDHIAYSPSDVSHMLDMIKNGNKGSGGVKHVFRDACGIVGFIRLQKGYYMIVITKRKEVGNIGYHRIYTIEDYELYYIPTEKTQSKSEEKYRNILYSFDLRKDFYFSYTYNLSHRLQFNMSEYHGGSSSTYKFMNDFFVWNYYHMKPFIEQYDHDRSIREWMVPIICGYFEQRKMDVYGSSVQLTLISRRSRFYAGTRYLKRGVNNQGQVANDVETEQILCETNTGIYMDKNISSFVQVRGSIPLFWNQDNTGGVPKPPIEIQRSDPFHTATILHFKNLYRRYGTPSYILNVVKTVEKNPRETKIGDGFKKAVEFINFSIKEEEHKIEYVAWDFKTACKQDKVLEDIIAISEDILSKVGYFYTNEKPYCNILREKRLQQGSHSYNTPESLVGIVYG
eukprot:TRINITY_DN5477_c0_g1_i2.p1 TRINITY_DN5477_c0_g1~~TRINITY_DN5477_c0_g1_i2.p1  ORF type:complete len:456 (+),score=60.55 TRINITY_DN5477_c0_g1_i2:3-1370(+)